MVLEPDALLRSMAVVLRQQIGPAVEEPFAKTQAFMAAVVLEKLAGQLSTAAVDGGTAAAERSALVADLREPVLAAPAPQVQAALAALADDGADVRWSALVAALYAERGPLGGAFEPLLGRVRVALRGRLDRALAYAS